MKRLPNWYKVFLFCFIVSAIYSFFQDFSPRHDAGLWPLVFAGFPWSLIGILNVKIGIATNFLVLIFVGLVLIKKNK